MNDTAVTLATGSGPAPDLTPAQAEDLLNAGRMLPRYRVREQVQRGSLSQVFLVEDLEFPRQLIAKFVVADMDELPLLCLHSNVPPVHDSGWAEGLRWSLQRYLPGCSLERILREEPERLSLGACLRLLHQIAETLAAVHEQGLVHCDVKPGNIHVGPHGECTLIDWDAACTLDALRAGARPGQGTPGYMPPEQRRGGACDQRLDVYALGACLHRIVQAKGSPPGRRGRSLQAIADRAMAEAPTNRYPDAGAFAADCWCWLEGQAVSVLPDGCLRRFGKAIVRHPSISVSLLLTVIALTTTAWLLIADHLQRQRHWHTILDEGFDEPLQDQQWQSWVLPLWDQESALRMPLDGASAPWVVREGRLIARLPPPYPGSSNLIFTHLDENDIRIRYQLYPQVNGRNCNVTFGGLRGERAILHIGGFEQPELALLTGPDDSTLALARMPAGLQPGRSYQMQIRYRMGDIALTIDGRPILQYHAPSGHSSSYLTSFGLECANNQYAIDNLVVERRKLPRILSGLEMVELLEAQGRFQAALDLLDLLQIEASTTLARARCLIQAGQPELARPLLRELTTEVEHGQTARLLLIELATEQGNRAQAWELLRDIVDPEQRQQALPLLDRLLHARFTAAWRLQDRDALAQAATGFREDWQQWQQYWQLDMRQWDWFQVPLHLRNTSVQLAELLQYQVVADLAALHPGLETHMLRWQGRYGDLPARHMSPDNRRLEMPTPNRLLPTHWPMQQVPDDPLQWVQQLESGMRSALGQNALTVVTLSANPQSLRLIGNARLVAQISEHPDQVPEEALRYLQQLVCFNGFLREELLLPACALAAAGHSTAARAHLRHMLARYPEDYLPRWQRVLAALPEGAQPDTSQVDFLPEHVRIPPQLVQALWADLQGHREQARHCYAEVAFDYPHWQHLLSWQQQR